MSNRKEILRINIGKRNGIDRPLVNWFFMLLLCLPTFGLYGIYILVLRIKRINGFICRKSEYYSILGEFTDSGAIKVFAENYSKRIKPINWQLTFLLMIVTFGLYFFIYVYKMNRIWNDLQIAESDFYKLLSLEWHSVGIIDKEISFQTDRRLNTSYVSNLFLSVVTFGVWLLVWDYRIHIAPERIYSSVHNNEDRVLSLI